MGLKEYGEDRISYRTRNSEFSSVKYSGVMEGICLKYVLHL